METNMKCPKCNARLPQNGSFCTECGEKVEQGSSHCSDTESGTIIAKEPEVLFKKTTQRPASVFLIILSLVLIAGGICVIAYDLKVPTKKLSEIKISREARKIRVGVGKIMGRNTNEAFDAHIEDLLNTSLEAGRDYDVVERKQIQNIYDELRLGASGVIDDSTAAGIGKLVGADVLVIGENFQTESTVNINKASIDIGSGGMKLQLTPKLLYVFTLRIVDVETGKKIGKGIIKKYEQSAAESIIEKEVTPSISAILQNMPKKYEEKLSLPYSDNNRYTKILVIIPEEILRLRPPDPACETEIVNLFQKAGYTILKYSDVSMVPEDPRLKKIIEGDSGTARQLITEKKVDFLLTGQAFAEEAGKEGPFSVFRARAEIKMVNVSGVMVRASAVQGGATDLSPNIAGKKALAVVGHSIATELLKSGNITMMNKKTETSHLPFVILLFLAGGTILAIQFIKTVLFV